MWLHGSYVTAVRHSFQVQKCVLSPTFDSQVDAREKMERELAPGAVIIDYTGACASERVRLVAQVVAPVSWNVAQVFHVYVAGNASLVESKG